METIVHKRRSNIAIHKQSHTLSKSKPNIRIIHIFAPEIIKTDTANFRDLVQRLTGKPDDEDDDDSRKTRTSIDHHRQMHNTIKKPPIYPAKETDPQNMFCTELEEAIFGDHDEEEEEEEEMTWSDNCGISGCFLNSSGDLDGFIQELCEVPYLPLAMDAAAAAASSSSHHMHGGSNL